MIGRTNLLLQERQKKNWKVKRYKFYYTRKRMKVGFDPTFTYVEANGWVKTREFAVEMNQSEADLTSPLTNQDPALCSQLFVRP